MNRYHPKPYDSLPVSQEIYHQLLSAHSASGFEKEMWEIGEIAICEWMARNNPNFFGMPATSGYQWKYLFLPSGTVLRTIYKGVNFHCLVDKDRIRYNGDETTPSRFVNTVGGVRRNAWEVVWLLFPNCKTWKLAATLRPKKTARKSKAQGPKTS
jgi:hypothetical protein